LGSCNSFDPDFLPGSLSLLWPQEERTGNSGFVRRFGTAERLFHWVTLVVFLVVMMTGVQQVLGGPGKHHIGPFHGNLGFALLILFLIDMFFWVKDALFKDYDLSGSNPWAGTFPEAKRICRRDALTPGKNYSSGACY
jgi:cytochrome b subunit of formate dehydrogenase